MAESNVIEVEMSQNKVKFSIITAVLNREATLAEALESLAEQRYDDYEHIVQDGGSTDGTLRILNNYAGPKQHLVSESDHGIYDALNRALARSTGDFIGLLHSDDRLAHPDVLLRVAQCFESSGADAVYGDLDYVSAMDTSRVIRRWRSGEYHPSRLRRGWMPPHPALFLKRHVIEKWGGYDTTYRIAADYDSILRYFGKGNISAVWIPEVLVKMRVGGESNRSLERILRKSYEDYRALRLNGIGGIRTLVSKNIGKLGQFFSKG
ncbi:glycosyltransferase [Mesorhizobium sp. M1169]|uniref:glycosyltransferase family 2 protein n=1 Tax=Mesorhizobium sp. M1169 TaxID=2957066 RepID=UPI00333AAF52